MSSEEIYKKVNAEIDAMVRAMRALLEGRFTEAEQLSLQVLEFGQRRHMSQSTAGTFGLQMFTLRREQGGLKGLEPVVKRFMQEHGATAAWRPGLALIYTELGRKPKRAQNSSTWHSRILRPSPETPSG